MKLADNWKDYKILDMANGQKLESWGGIILSRPDPQIVWSEKQFSKLWDKSNAIYHRSKQGGGCWEYKKNTPERWTVKYKDLTFNIKLMGFKHTGLFPEQAVNWDYMIDKITNSNRHINVLNLFAYTGGATVACAYAGADVVHVDSSKGMVSWAKENIVSSNLEDRYVRFIVDDVIKFVEREIRRGHKYDAIIMDPPTYGRGPSKELWRFEDSLNKLIDSCIDILSDNPLFLLISSYTKGITPEILKNILETSVEEKLKNGKIKTDEIGLQISTRNMILPCGVYGRWEKNEN